MRLHLCLIIQTLFDHHLLLKSFFFFFCRSNDTRAVNADASRSSLNNVTVIEVSSTPDENVFSFNRVNHELSAVERHEDVSVVSVMPVNSSLENALPVVRRAVAESADERSPASNVNGW